jgi:hypothetical protein
MATQPLKRIVAFSTIAVAVLVTSGPHWTWAPDALTVLGEATAAPAVSTAAACGNPALSTTEMPGQGVLVLDWSRARVTRDQSGAAALSYITTKEAQNPVFRHVRQHAAAKLRSRGLQPTSIVRVGKLAVPRVFPAAADRWRLDKLLGLIEPRLHAEEFEDFEIIAESWDDGDNYTWEGNVYVEDTTSGHWISANEQQQLPAEPYPVNWAEPVQSNIQPTYHCNKKGSACGYCGTPSAASCNLRTAIDDRWPYCAGGAFVCLATGPAWLVCAGLNCWGQTFGGWLWQTKQHLQQCWLDEQERTACGG